MTTESVTWFAGQLVALISAAVIGLRVAKCPASIWKAVATAAAGVMLLWPLLRVFPGEALRLFGAGTIVFIELTGVVVPAALLFAIASRTMRNARERRAVAMLLAVCGLYFVKAGWWMVGPRVPELRTSTYADGVCRQSTDYTCVAASLVTMLRAHGVETSETEMARLSYTEIGGGATDTRAVLALERKLAELRAARPSGAPRAGLRAELLTLRDPERLAKLPLPALVSTRWGYFISHMMPMLAVDKDAVMVGDPMTGPRRIPLDEFRREWRGWAIVLRESDF